MSWSQRTFGWLRDGIGNLAAAREIEDSMGAFTFGTKYYVATTSEVSNASDNNLGTSAREPFATIAKANAVMASNRNDVCYISAASGHTLSTELVISNSRVHFVGTGFRSGVRQGQRSRISMGVTTGTGIAAIKITGTGVTLSNLKISSADTLSTSIYAVADGGEFTVLRNCWLEKSTDLAVTGAAELLCNGDTASYIGCTFGNMIYRPSVARQNVLFTRETITGKVARAVSFDDCNFLGFPSATTFSHLRATTNDIERFANLVECRLLSKVGGSIAAEAVTIGSALTDGGIFLDRCLTNATNIATASSEVYSNLPNSASLGGKVTEVT